MICDYCEGEGHMYDLESGHDSLGQPSVRYTKTTCSYCDGTGELLDPQEGDFYDSLELSDSENW